MRNIFCLWSEIESNWFHGFSPWYSRRCNYLMIFIMIGILLYHKTTNMWNKIDTSSVQLLTCYCLILPLDMRGPFSFHLFLSAVTFRSACTFSFLPTRPNAFKVIIFSSDTFLLFHRRFCYPLKSDSCNELRFVFTSQLSNNRNNSLNIIQKIRR